MTREEAASLIQSSPEWGNSKKYSLELSNAEALIPGVFLFDACYTDTATGEKDYVPLGVVEKTGEILNCTADY